MDVNQTLVDLTKQQHILIEHNINRICYRDMVEYANALHSPTTGQRDLPDLYSAAKNKPTINLARLTSFISTDYNCESPVDITAIDCSNPDMAENMNVRLWGGSKS